MANDYAQKYFDALISNYDLITEAITKANERGLKVSQRFATDVAKGQREALELGKKLALSPNDVGQVYAALIESSTAAQGRALAFTQIAYQEALAAGVDARDTVQKLVEANNETTKAAVEFARAFATSNPFAEVVRQTMEAVTPKAS
jgi:hypothetical protein